MGPPLCADSSLLTKLCTSLSAGLPRSGGTFMLSFTLVLQARLTCSSAAQLFTLSFSFSQTRLLSARDLQHLAQRQRFVYRCHASACAGPCNVSSSGSSVPILALVESRHSSAQFWSTPETLRHRFDKEFPGCLHFIWDISLAEPKIQIRLLSLKSPAPRGSERQCQVPKVVTHS